MRVALGCQAQAVGEDGAGVAVCKVEELEGYALLVAVDAEGAEDEVDEAGIAWAFCVAGVV